MENRKKSRWSFLKCCNRAQNLRPKPSSSKELKSFMYENLDDDKREIETPAFGKSVYLIENETYGLMNELKKKHDIDASLDNLGAELLLDDIAEWAIKSNNITEIDLDGLVKIISNYSIKRKH